MFSELTSFSLLNFLPPKVGQDYTFLALHVAANHYCIRHRTYVLRSSVDKSRNYFDALVTDMIDRSTYFDFVVKMHLTQKIGSIVGYDERVGMFVEVVADNIRHIFSTPKVEVGLHGVVVDMAEAIDIAKPDLDRDFDRELIAQNVYRILFFHLVVVLLLCCCYVVVLLLSDDCYLPIGF